uniref:Uncharacterized protein n=1 Tax=Hyaloperonospora arabidopsidis (strain Emoy2) TaxID=559515 RepID=M4C712_HYAAE
MLRDTTAARPSSPAQDCFVSSEHGRRSANQHVQHEKIRLDRHSMTCLPTHSRHEHKAADGLLSNEVTPRYNF